MKPDWPTIVAALTLGGTILNHFHIRKVHLLVNSGLTRWVEASSKASHAAGKEEGRAEQIVRADMPCDNYKPWPHHHGEDNQHLCWNCAWTKSSHTEQKG